MSEREVRMSEQQIQVDRLRLTAADEFDLVSSADVEFSRANAVDSDPSRVEGEQVDQQIGTAASALPLEGELRSLSNATEWLNSPPLTASDLQGKVVLINFWTYTCINWLRSLPYIRAWAEKYQDHGLVVVGVHAPEFAFEHTIENVRQAVKDLNVPYPVAIDNDFTIWRAFENHYWPALYLFDPKRNVRYHHFGEGEYVRSEIMIQRLLAEASGRHQRRRIPGVRFGRAPRGVSRRRLGQPEVPRNLPRLRTS